MFFSKPKLSNVLKKMSLDSEQGFSLPSVILGASIMSAMGLAFATMLSQMNSTVGYIEDRSAALDLKHIMALELSSTQACTNSFGGLAANANQNLANIKNSNDVIAYQRNQTHDRLNITNFRLEVVNPPIAPSGTGRMNLIVDLDRDRNSGPSSLKPQPIPLSVTSNGAGRIVSCVAIGEGAAASGEDTAGQCETGPPNGSRGRFGPLARTNSGPFPEGTIQTTADGVRTSNQGVTTTKYLCINKRWAAVSSEYQSSRL